MISGERVRLRLPIRADRSRWLEVLRDEDQLRWGSPAFLPLPAVVEDLDARIDDAARHHAGLEPGTFVVVHADTPEHFLGVVAWRWDVPKLLQVADIGYSVHPDARGQGVARSAVITLARWLTRDSDGPLLARVQLDHSVENPASCRVADAAGFLQEGVRRAFLPLRDTAAPDGVRRHDVCLHGFVPQR